MMMMMMMMMMKLMMIHMFVGITVSCYGYTVLLGGSWDLSSTVIALTRVISHCKYAWFMTWLLSPVNL